MIVNSQVPVTTVKTFIEFADGIIKFVENLSSGCSPIDIVCDSYFDSYLKSHHVKPVVVDNFFHRQKQPLYQRSSKVIFQGTIEIRLPYFWQVSSLYIERTQEEADTQIIVRVKHCLLNGSRNIVIKTVGNDVITLLLAHLSLLNS